MRTLAELESFIARDDQLSSLRERVAQNLSDDNSHDLGHALRVALWTLNLGCGEVCPREAIAASLCHDLVNIPKNSPRRADASRLSATRASEFLADYGFDSPAIVRISEAIRDHSYSRGVFPGSALGRALQDADRLEALGAIGIMRTISTGVRMGTKYFDPNDPWALSRTLDDQSFSVDHFFTKLFQLRNTMCTRRGRDEAERRLGIMYEFLDALAMELAMPRPENSNLRENAGESR
jgi:uncharacterized protein